MTLSDSLHKLNKLTGGLHTKLNPDFPDLVLLTQDGKNPENGFFIRDKMYQEGKFRIYIGKMLQKGENIYSKIVLENYIGEQLNQCQNKGSYFTIELCKSVGDILNEDQDSKDNTMTIQEQKQLLIDIIKKNYGKSSLKKVNIISLDDQPEHQELLNTLRDNGLKGLCCQKIPPLPNDISNSSNKIDSIDIAKYLYWVCLQNDEFMKMIYETKSESLRNKEGNKFDRKRNSDFYGMIEIAIRITDFINGIMIQGGVRRQEKYDKIIRFLLDYNLNKELDSFQRKNLKPQKYYDIYNLPTQKDKQEQKELQEERELQKEKRDQEENKIKSKHRKIPELDDLQDRLQKNKQWKAQPFYSQHFNTSSNENQEIKEKKFENQKIKTQISMIKYITTAAIVLVLGGAKVYDNYNQKKIQEMTIQTMDEIFKDKKVGERADMYSSNYEGKEAAEFIKNKYVDRLVFFYQIRYGKIKHMSQQEFRYKIISSLNNQKILNILSDAEKRDLNLNMILDEIFVPQYIGELKYNKMETMPYAQYAEYEQGFVNILEADSSIFDDTKFHTDLSSAGYDPRINDYKKSKFFRVDPIGDFARVNINDIHGTDWYGNGMVYSLGLKTRYDDTWTKEIPYVVARGPFWIGEYKCENAENTKRDLNLSKQVAINYFLQTKPVILDILNEYIVRYKHFSGPLSSASNYIPNQDMPIRNIKLRDSIIEMFIKDIVKNKIYQKIQPGEHENIIKYVDECVQKNKDQLIQDRENVIPYSFHNENLSIIQRTLSSGYKLDEYWIDLPRDNYKYHTSNLGYYRTNNGRYYHVIKAKINGQEYIYASSISDIYYEGQENIFGRNQGIDVATDFMTNHYPLLKSQ